MPIEPPVVSPRDLGGAFLRALDAAPELLGSFAAFKAAFLQRFVNPLAGQEAVAYLLSAQQRNGL